MQYLGAVSKNDRMISVHFQVKPFNITVIQVYASNAKEADVERFYEDLQDLLELTPKKDVFFITGDWNTKVGSQETPRVTGKFGLELQNEAVCVCVSVCVWVTQSCLTLQPHGLWPARLLCPRDSPGKSTGMGCHFLLQNEAEQRLIEFCQENALVIEYPLSTTQEMTLHMDFIRWWNTKIRLIIFFADEDGEAQHSQQKWDLELTVTQIMSSLLKNSDLSWRK